MCECFKILLYDKGKYYKINNVSGVSSGGAVILSRDLFFKLILILLSQNIKRAVHGNAIELHKINFACLPE